MNRHGDGERRLLLGGGSPGSGLPPSLAGWYPVLAGEDGLWWRFFGEKRFTEPFFHDSVVALNRQDRRCLHSGYDALEAFGAAPAPTAFIFHTSRCGSTLLTQMLATSAACVAISEPTAIDAYLDLARARAGDAAAARNLAGIVAALGQRRRRGEHHLFIKLDSWHIGELPLFRRAFPATPFLFLYREPGEILASHRRRPGRQMVPGLIDLGIDAAMTGYGEGYRMAVLKQLFGEARRHAQELHLLHYRQLPRVTWETLPELLSIAFPPAEIEAMRACAGRHAKRPEPFAGDPPTPMDASGEGRDAALDALYAWLEELRMRRKESPCPGAGMPPGMAQRL